MLPGSILFYSWIIFVLFPYPFVFISNTKILTAVKINSDDEKIDVSVPRITHFIHRCYVEVAREIYKNPYLYDKSIDK